MKNTKPLLGFCPIGKFVFSNEDAVKCKEATRRELDAMQVKYVDLDGVLEDGLVKDQAHVEIAVKHLSAAGIDCLFVPHCNFGTEGAVGAIAARLGVPVLLWGPRDEAPLPDGTRLRDTLCGMFASSKVMHKMGVEFTYIENCRLANAAFKKGVDTFLRAANVANAFRKGIRVGHIGQRIDFFWTTIINESELLERFNVEVIPIDMVEFIGAAKKRAAARLEDYRSELRELEKSCTIEGFEDDMPMINVLAVRDEMLELGESLRLDGFAEQTFMSIINEMGSYCTYASSEVSERFPVGCESDIHGTISNILLQKAAYDSQPAYLADLTIRHPDNDNGILLWHAGAPLSMRDPSERVRLGTHWILPSPLSGMTHFRLKDGTITAARFDGDRGEYKLAVGQGHSIAGPKTLNNYVWMEVDNWPRWERILMEGPFIHHVGMVYGHYADSLLEACKYISGLTPVPLNES